MYTDSQLDVFLAILDVNNMSAYEIMNGILTDARGFLSNEYEGDDITVVVTKLL
jgi:serine phosphatase RsbU (regulator of sigma subunit)